MAYGWRRRRSAAPRRPRTIIEDGRSLFFVSLDKDPARVTAGKIAAEGPHVAGLNGIGQRAGDHFTRRVTGDGGDVGLEPNRDGRGRTFQRGRGDHRLLDRHQAIVEAVTRTFTLTQKAAAIGIDKLRNAWPGNWRGSAA